MLKTLIIAMITSTTIALAAPACAPNGGPGSARPVAPMSFANKPSQGTKAWCPMMKQAFFVSEGTEFSQYKGRWYAFCCKGCKPRFDADPAKHSRR